MRRSLIAIVLAAALVPGLAIAHEGRATTERDSLVEIRATEHGFVPATVEVPAGRAVTLVFRRTTDRTCAREAVFPALKRTVQLPLNRPVRVTVRPRAGHPIAFACGMGMYSGQVVVR